MAPRTDVVIAGAGMAGSALAFELAPYCSVLVLEREAQPGYHSTGRSAAMLTETYGTPAVRALARASRPFLEHPPEGFAPEPLLSARGMLHIARADQRAALDQAQALAHEVPGTRRVDGAGACALVPILDPRYVDGGLLEPDARAIDVASLHLGFLKGLRARGGRILTEAEITRVERTGSGWRVDTRAGAFEGAILVDAAGAWADELASLAGVAPIDIVPKRRTAVIVAPPDGMDPSAWPMVIDVEEQFYFKPEGGKLMLSPADETPLAPSDVQPEELDVAVAIDRYQRATGRTVRRVERRWAGLRSFVADHDPVIGPDPQAPGFVWLAALGGFGIMTAPAAARLAAALITGEARLEIGPDLERLGPGRLRRG